MSSFFQDLDLHRWSVAFASLTCMAKLVVACPGVTSVASPSLLSLPLSLSSGHSALTEPVPASQLVGFSFPFRSYHPNHSLPVPLSYNLSFLSSSYLIVGCFPVRLTCGAGGKPVNSLPDSCVLPYPNELCQLSHPEHRWRILPSLSAVASSRRGRGGIYEGRTSKIKPVDRAIPCELGFGKTHEQTA